MRQLLKTASKFSVVILMLTLWGCAEVESLLPTVTADFTFTLDQESGTVTFVNTSEDADKYEWDFGDGTTSNEINPVKKYTATGNYSVTLKALSNAGASDTTEPVVISVTVLQAVTLPITFDDADIDYEATTFGGVSFAVVANPDQSGSNDKAGNVGAITNSGAAFEGFFYDLGAALDLTTEKTVKANFWADAPVAVLLKLEQGTAAPIEISVDHGGTGWEEIAFDFTSSDQYSRLTFFVDGPGTTAGTFYIDDIEQAETQTGGGNTGGSIEDCGGDLVNDFETADNSIFNNFGGGVGTIIDNPDTSVNTSAKVGQYVKGAGEVFAGITIEVDPDIDFNAGVFSIDVSSQAVRQLLFKLEGLGIEQIIPTSGTGWETITYDFSAVGGNVGNVTAITLIMDNGTAGDGSADWTIQFDNIRLCSNQTSGGACSGGPTADVLAFPVDFENCEGFNVSFGSLQTRAIVDNPVSGGINTSNKVYQFIKPAGAEGFGGFQNIFDFGTFTNNSTITFKIYSTLPNQDIRLEIVAIPNDGGLIGNPAPYTQTLTTANEWVEMSFDLSANAFPNADQTVYTMLVVKPGNIDGGNTPADVTFYLDDFAITAN